MTNDQNINFPFTVDCVNAIINYLTEESSPVRG